MRLRRVIGLLSLGIWGALGCAEMPSTSPEFTAPAGRFAMAFPDTPTMTTSTVALAGDSLTTTLYTLTDPEKKAVVYTVSYTDYPVHLVLRQSHETLLETAQTTIAAQSKATIRHAEPIMLDIHPGRAFVLDWPDQHAQGLAHIFIVFERLYQVMITFPAEATPEDSTTLAETLNSFRLLLPADSTDALAVDSTEAVQQP